MRSALHFWSDNLERTGKTARRGRSLHAETDGAAVLAPNIVVDQRAGVVVNWSRNTTRTRAAILDTHDCTVRHTVDLNLPGGGIQSPIAVDATTGDIYGFGGQGIYAIRPGAWKQARAVLSGPTILGIALAVSPRYHRVFSLEWDRAPQPYHDTMLWSFCSSTCRQDEPSLRPAGLRITNNRAVSR